MNKYMHLYAVEINKHMHLNAVEWMKTYNFAYISSMCMLMFVLLL